VKPSSFVVITGLSGSGKATFLRALEDRGYFCVDNLPVGLLGKFYELIGSSDEPASRVAIVIDVREGESLRGFPAVYQELKKQAGADISLWFLEASDAALIRRFSETRRPHPLDPGRPVMDSLAHEREVMAPIRAIADHVLDTSAFNIHDLRKHALSLLESRSTPHLLISVVSFGFKYGVPIDSDLVFDVRFLPNPNFVPHLKPKTGGDSEVIEYMNAQAGTGEFLKHLEGFLDYVVPQYAREGKSYVTIAIGCTGGRHRSVFIANEVGQHFSRGEYRVKVSHRDWEKS
jgi:UPF0042 nucleotide-binding protein